MCFDVLAGSIHDRAHGVSGSAVLSRVSSIDSQLQRQVYRWQHRCSPCARCDAIAEVAGLLSMMGICVTKKMKYARSSGREVIDFDTIVSGWSEFREDTGLCRNAKGKLRPQVDSVVMEMLMRLFGARSAVSEVQGQLRRDATTS